MSIILKGFIKQPVIKQSPPIPSFFILIERFFSFLTKEFVKSEKLIRFHHHLLLYVKMDKI